MIDEFADLLRHHRLDAGLSQLALAERAGLSLEAISSYERSLRFAPRAQTVVALADALDLTGAERTAFEIAAANNRSSRATVRNLPGQPTSFVGRANDIAQITAQLAVHRVVTVIGAGGIGKTRVAFEAATRLASPPAGGIWIVDLGLATDGPSAMRRIAAQLELDLPESDDAPGTIAAALRAHHRLIILDNCEHVLEPARTAVAAIAAACAGISFLTTSRERLGIRGEVIYPLQPLDVPVGSVTSIDAAKTYPALELFFERASAGDRKFVPSRADLPAVVEICRQLGGNALAIEFAAARVPFLGLDALRHQLTSHFGSAIAWSHDLLSDAERRLFRRLAIFANGWTLEAVQDVCADSPLERSSALDLLNSLCEKSLVVARRGEAQTRYGFLQSTRAFALEQLAQAREDAALSLRHAQWVASLADRAQAMYFVKPRREWERVIMGELDNAIVALDWALGVGGDSLIAARITIGLEGHWETAGLPHGRRSIETVLANVRTTGETVIVARLLLVSARFLHGDALTATAQQAIGLLRDSDDRCSLARSYGILSHAFGHRGEFANAEVASERAGTILREAGLAQTPLYSSHLCARSSLLRAQDRLDDARLALVEALALAKLIDDDWLLMRCQSLLAEIEFAAGRFDEALALGYESLDSARRARSTYHEIYSLCNLACYQLALGDLTQAEASARETIELTRPSKASANALHAAAQHLATVAALRGDPRRGAYLLGYVDKWFEQVGYRRDTTDQKGYEILTRSLQEQLAAPELQSLLAQGRLLTEAIAIAFALSS